MISRSPGKGFSLVEVIVVLVIIVVVATFVLPAIEIAREASRRTICQDNMRQIGRATGQFLGTKLRFPSSSQIQQIGDERVETWSWLAQILPYIDHQHHDLSIEKLNWNELPTNTEENRKATATVVRSFICPSYKGDRTCTADEVTAGITNYKAIGATHFGSLEQATVGGKTEPAYSSETVSHPDGALIPAVRGLRERQYKDGISHTLLATETIENTFAAWTQGTHATLVGLPTTGPGRIEFTDSRWGYVKPNGFDGTFTGGEMFGNAQTYLSTDYEITPYEGLGSVGPSSEHVGVVHHLMADGTVVPINVDINVSLYMFLITRSSGDPTGSFNIESR